MRRSPYAACRSLLLAHALLAPACDDEVTKQLQHDAAGVPSAPAATSSGDDGGSSAVPSAAPDASVAMTSDPDSSPAGDAATSNARDAGTATAPVLDAADASDAEAAAALDAARSEAATPRDAGQDSGGEPDGGLCAPPAPAEPQAPAPECYPDCIQQLQAACTPSGTCGAAWDAQTDTQCWTNGVQLVNFYPDDQPLDAFVFDTTLHVWGQTCYSVQTSQFNDGSTKYVWTDGCGATVAVGLADAELVAVEVECVADRSTHQVDLNSEGCGSLPGAVPYDAECAEDATCEHP